MDEEGVMKSKIKVYLRFLAVVLFTLIFSALKADDFTVTWNQNSEDDLKGYIVYWGTASRNYTDSTYTGTDTT